MHCDQRAAKCDASLVDDSEVMGRAFEIMASAERHAAFLEALGDLAALGAVENRHSGATFGMIGARSNARWLLLPLENNRQAHSGLGLFQAASASAWAAKLAAATACGLGLQGLLFRRQIQLTGVAALAARLNRKASAFAIFTGTNGPHRKTTIQLMDSGGRILGYAKITRRDLVRPWLAREAQMLRHVRGLRLGRAVAPELLAFETGEHVPSVLVTDSQRAGGHASPRKPGQTHLGFLAELVQRTGRNGAERALGELAELATDRRLPVAWTQRFRDGLQRLAPSASVMPVALAHGDFTPWNSFVLGERLYIFDWEYAAEDWPLGYDLAHYLLASASTREPEAVVGTLVPQLAHAFHRGDASAAEDALLMSLLLHARFYLCRELEAYGNAQGWGAGARRGALIDVLLRGGRA